MTNTEIKQFVTKGRKQPDWFFTNVLDVKKEHLWQKMVDMAYSVRDNEKTCVQAGHGVSKTYTLARIALQFLYTYCPSTVITTAPSQDQVEDLLWREIHSAHANAKVPLKGKLTTVELDLQPETGKKWFATGFSTRADTVTAEATKMQGYHNDNLLLIFDEAMGILPEIWRAAYHIGAPFKRWIAVGNVTSGTGDFVDTLEDPAWHNITVSVTDTPNFKAGKTIIPGIYGLEYEQEIRTKYGVESDEYRVRVLGLKSERQAVGSYYSAKISKLRREGRIGHIVHNPHYKVHIVADIGYTSSYWFVQMRGTSPHFIDYYEDSGVGIEDYCRLFEEWKKTKGYQYGEVIVPCDMDSNATRIVTGQTALETMRSLGWMARPLPRESRVIEGIQRTQKFLDDCYFSAACDIGIKKIASYHERINRRMSTETLPVFTGEPEKDGSDHAADSLRYVSMAAGKGLLDAQTRRPTQTEAIQDYSILN